MNLLKPNFLDMAAARAEFDQRINQVGVLLAPAPSMGPIEGEVVSGMVNKHLKAAREALNKFEDAARGQ